MTPMHIFSSKTAFVASTIGIILGLFFIGHVGLVAVYQTGTAATIVTAVICSVAVAALFKWRQNHRFFPLLAGTALWAVLGEMAEHLGYMDITDAWFVFVLAASIIVFTCIVCKHFLPFFFAVSLGLFLAVWASHFIMVNLFDLFGKRHGLTYASSLLFAGFLVLSMFRIKRTGSMLELTMGSILFTCSSWSLLEYLWAWNVIPKPW
jgi:hypothetical protein